MAKKRAAKVTAKKVIAKAAKKKTAKKTTKKAAAVVPSPSSVGRVRGPGTVCNWQLYERSGVLGVKAQAQPNFCLLIDCGQPVASVEASLNGEPLGPKVSGSQVGVKCAGGSFEALIVLESSDPSDVSVSYWEV